ncbi:MATE family efflux transporter [Zongyangia hominis]|uniref:Multidrug export protein MepA n=1 Tax=Zongyangia hominis TaxID=2763677 RepID=A0A926EFF3_9FIRM|nr:MATE family efflux transporter [Zongyangia hominis]MBC8571179.1 MATE family efflux transporter [Zongyangia hominis]
MKPQQPADLGNDSIGKLLVRLAVPAIVAQLVNMLYNIVDRIYIGNGVGSLALTGVGVTFPIIMLISAFSSLIGMGGAPRASIYMGQQRYDKAEQTLGNCFTSLIAISVVLTVALLWAGKPLLMVFGASSDTIGYATDYMNIYVCGTLFVQLALGLNTFISSQGFATQSMLTVLIGAVINIVLDPIFIFVFHMGVQGAALATIISQAISAAWVLCFLFGKSTKLKIRRKNLRVKLSVLLPVLALGVSPFIMQSTESLLNICFNSSLQRYGGDLAVGAMTIMGSLMQVLMMPLMGLTQGAQPIVGYNFGAKKNDRVKKAFRLLMIACVAFTSLFWLSMMFFPQIFIRLFNNDPELLRFTEWSIRIYLGAGFIMGAQIACQQTFIAVGQAKSSLFLAVLRKIILLIPLIYLLPLFLEDKVFAVFLAEPISDILATTTTILLFAFQFKKILKNNEPTPAHSPVSGHEVLIQGEE